MDLIKIIALILLCFFVSHAHSQINLMGDNAPHPNMLDGDFNAVWANWRAKKQSPDWTTRIIKGKGPIALHQGALFCMGEIGVAESKKLLVNPDYQTPIAGDEWAWSFGADLEYISDGRISLSLVFGKVERMLAEKIKLQGSDKKIEHFSGNYIITKEDAIGGMPFVRVTFYSEQDIKVYLHYVNIHAVAPEKVGPRLNANIVTDGIRLHWIDDKSSSDDKFCIYRAKDEREGFIKIGEALDTCFTDSTIINGIEYNYIVTRLDDVELESSNKIQIVRTDHIAPAPPTNLGSEIYDTEVKITWTNSEDADVASYSVYRSDESAQNNRKIASDVRSNFFLDFTPNKGTKNTYFVYAHDYSGNKSVASKPISTQVEAVFGASFSDLILPIPIHHALSSEMWGAEGVRPRDPDNGIEHPDWSYWGGRPVLDKDGRYHMLVTRWPANATKGHWEWPHSTVAYTVAENPTGPYQVKRDIAYDFQNGLGHNPDIILLNDGTFMLYSLINWEATLFTAGSMNGPWKRLGTMKVDEKTTLEKPERFYRFYRNLSGVHLEDGRFLFVTKGGAMMISEGQDPLGPYKVLTSPLQHNPIIPHQYRNSNYEDPVIWKDDVQFHMIINAFWDYRAIYLRSKDGIHWKFDPGTAYTPNCTSYEDGTVTAWYKLERPHVIQDEYGRATHLSLAVIDVPKADDLARDEHSSKNIILPLMIHKRLEILNQEQVNTSTQKIQVLIKSEPGFDAQNDIDFSSLRFGASEEVNFGRGSKLTNSKESGKDLILEFDGLESGITDSTFSGKLLGKTSSGELLIGFSNLVAKN